MIDDNRHVVVLDIDSLKFVERAQLGIVRSKKHAIAGIESGVGNARGPERKQKKGSDDEQPAVLQKDLAIPFGNDLV